MRDDEQRERGIAVGSDGGEPSGAERARSERTIAVALGVTILAGVGLFFVYFLGGNAQLEGVLFFLALGGLGVAMASWAEHLLDSREVSEERHELSSGPG